MRPYLLASAPLKTLVRRLLSIAALVVIDISGLVIGLYGALALRALVLDPKPILWGLLWDQETNWLAFLILLLLLVYWRARLYAPREQREGVARVVPSTFLVSLLALAFAIGTGQHFTTFGLYVVGAILVAALVGLPLWLLIALAIKLSSRGPVFYSDRRIGLGEQPFQMCKFRTMVAGAEEQMAELEDSNEASGALFKIRDDPRVTTVGRFLRRLSIDEVPNVLNVLRGEMSLVGPRPLPVRDYDLLEPWHRRRYNVLPGITGLWQIAGRSDLTFDDLVRLDFYYLENWSIWLDVTILFKTPLAVFSQRGAY